ncbi:hypothetical protein ACTXT7_003064 [Hymenolepis weldensis]
MAEHGLLDYTKSSNRLNSQGIFPILFLSFCKEAGERLGKLMQNPENVPWSITNQETFIFSHLVRPSQSEAAIQSSS